MRVNAAVLEGRRRAMCSAIISGDTRIVDGLLSDAYGKETVDIGLLRAIIEGIVQKHHCVDDRTALMGEIFQFARLHETVSLADRVALFHDAIKSRDLDSIALCQYLFSNAAEMMHPGDKQMTALHYSAVAGVQPVTTMLFERRRILPVEFTGMTPIHMAAIKGQYRSLMILLAGALEPDLNRQNNCGYTALTCITYHLKEGELVASAAAGETPSENSRRERCACALINTGAVDINLQSHEPSIPTRIKVEHPGSTALHWVIRRNNMTVFQALLKRDDIDVTLRDNRGVSVWDLVKENRPMREKFEAQFFTGDKANTKGEYPIHIAVQLGLADKVEELRVRFPERFTATTTSGKNLVHLALDNFHMGGRALALALIKQRPEFYREADAGGQTPEAMLIAMRATTVRLKRVPRRQQIDAFLREIQSCVAVQEVEADADLDELVARIESAGGAAGAGKKSKLKAKVGPSKAAGKRAARPRAKATAAAKQAAAESASAGTKEEYHSSGSESDEAGDVSAAAVADDAPVAAPIATPKKPAAKKASGKPKISQGGRSIVDMLVVGSSQPKAAPKPQAKMPSDPRLAGLTGNARRRMRRRLAKEADATEAGAAAPKHDAASVAPTPAATPKQDAASPASTPPAAVTVPAPAAAPAAEMLVPEAAVSTASGSALAAPAASAGNSASSSSVASAGLFSTSARPEYVFADIRLVNPAVHGVCLANLSEQAQLLVHSLLQKNMKIFLIGGAVRDLMIQKSSGCCAHIHDFDFVIDGDLSDVEKVFSKYKVSRQGRAPHEVLVVEIDGVSMDISSLNCTRENLWPHVKGDIGRRDLTINAFLLDMEDFNLYGMDRSFEDFEDRVLSALSRDAVQMLKEDPVRYLRVLRFHQKLDGFKLHPALASALETAHEHILCGTDMHRGVGAKRMSEQLHRFFESFDSIQKGLDVLFQYKLLSALSSQKPPFCTSGAGFHRPDGSWVPNTSAQKSFDFQNAIDHDDADALKQLLLDTHFLLMDNAHPTLDVTALEYAVKKDARCCLSVLILMGADVSPLKPSVDEHHDASAAAGTALRT